MQCAYYLAIPLYTTTPGRAKFNIMKELSQFTICLNEKKTALDSISVQKYINLNVDH